MLVVASKKRRQSSGVTNGPRGLITLSEAQNRIGNEETSDKRNGLSYISDDADVLPVFHTVIDFGNP